MADVEEVLAQEAGNTMKNQTSKPAQTKSCIECGRPLLVGKDLCAQHAHQMKRFLHMLDKAERQLGSNQV